MGKWNYFGIVLCVLFLQTFVSKAQTVSAQENNLKFEHLSVNEGLSQSTVFSLLQDRQGFIWIGTRTGGLNKYDGYTFKHYKKDQEDPYSISGNEIVALCETKDGQIWVGTRGEGLNRFDPLTEKFYSYHRTTNYDSGLYDNTIIAIAEDSYGQLWVGTNGGISVYNAEADIFEKVENSLAEKTFGHIYALSAAAEGELLIGTKNEGMYLLDVKSKIVKDVFQSGDDEHSLSGKSVFQILYDSKGGVWAGTRNNGLNYCSNLSTKKFIRYKNDPDNDASLTSNIIRTLCEDKSGAIWVGTKNGIDVISSEDIGRTAPNFIHFKKSENDQNGLNHNSIYSFIEDSYGNYWAGTWSGGVNHMIQGGKNFEHYWHQAQNPESISHNLVSSFAENSKGLWVGTEGGGLNLYDKQTGVFKAYSNQLENASGLMSDHVKALVVDDDGDLWVGTFKGLHLFDPTTSEFTPFLDGKSVYSIKEGTAGELWVATSNGLHVITKSDFQVTSYYYVSDDKNSISNSSILYVFKDKDERLWIGTRKGLNLYNRSLDNFIRFTHDEEDRTTISNNFVSSIGQDTQGNIWIGTSDGLNKYNPSDGTFSHYGEKQGLPDNVISNIQTDNSGGIWVTTNRGLSKITLSAKEASDTSAVTISEVRTFENSDGLQGNEFTLNSSYKNEYGELYFGGANGFNKFFPDKLQENQKIPPVVFTGFKLFNKPVEIGAEGSLLKKHISSTEKIKFNHKQKVFSFEFVGLNYISPEKNKYAYILEGFNDDWVDLGDRREVSFTNLPPGDYTLKVIASNNDGYWNEEGASIELVVKPAWYKTLLFYIIVLLVVVFVVFNVVKMREQQLKSNQALLESQLADGKREIKEQQEKVEKQALELEERNEREKQAKWHNRGVIDMSKLISEKRNNMKLLANSIIVELVTYIDVQMGALYIKQSDEGEQVLELMGGYALDGSHFENKTVSVGEGLVGTCVLNKEIMEVDDLPVGYATLGSGLGEANLSQLTLVPVVYEGEIEGVIELISFEKVPAYKINLVKTICETLGATLINVRANSRIENMLQESNDQKETLFQHEEELKQNLEELQATQEESAKREEQLLAELEQLKNELSSKV